MIINIIGDCDKRPVLFTVMKICQSLGDVILVTSSSRLIRLADTHENFGHYQNTMIAVTSDDDLDEFWENCAYAPQSFNFCIVDNVYTEEADVYIYVKGMTQSTHEQNMVEGIEEVNEIDLYTGHLVDGTTLMRCEEFESMQDMCVINPKVVDKVAPILAKAIHTDAKRIAALGNVQTSTHPTKVPAQKRPSAGGLFSRR